MDRNLKFALVAAGLIIFSIIAFSVMSVSYA